MPERYWKLGAGLVFATGCLPFLVKPAGADRIVLGPAGSTLTENSYLSQFAVGTSRKIGDYGWLAYSSSDGIEMELNRFESTAHRNKLYSMNIEYPMPTLRDLPAISLGVRDITGTGMEHGAFYLAATRQVPLSKRNHSLFRTINISAGAGTGRIGGAFVGIESRLTAGLSINAEIYRHRPNVGIGVPLIRNAQLNAYSIDGDIFYGMSYHWSR